MMDAGALPSHHDKKIDIRVTSLLAAGDRAVHAERQEVPSLSTSEIRCNRLGECETTGDRHRLGQTTDGRIRIFNLEFETNGSDYGSRDRSNREWVRQGSYSGAHCSTRMATDVHTPRFRRERRLAAALGIAVR